jgi:hypothetical protein
MLGVVAAALYAGLAAGPALACDGYGHCQPPCPRWVPPPPCPTELATGPDTDDLKIQVVGPHFDTIEVYFKTEYFYRETFPHTWNLHCGNRISLAAKNKFGTFAVLVGDGSLVRAYGWKSSVEKPVSIDIPVEKGHAVVMEWVTDRILKVRHGSWLSRSTIVRFNDADKPWTELFKN